MLNNLRGRVALQADADVVAARQAVREVAARLGLSRVTARRYLEHLAESGEATRAPRYGTRGRPELEYRRRA